jgi:hypothetical protein
MKRFSKLGTVVLAGYLIAAGAIPILHLGSPTVSAVLNIGAIAAGVLLLLDR